MSDRLSVEDAAAKLGAFYWEHRGQTFHIEEVTAETGLTVVQIGKAERLLKTFLNEHHGKFKGYMLFVALGNESEHGFVQDSPRLKPDVLRRAKYMNERSKSELAYREQMIGRVASPVARKKLQRGVEYQRAALAMYEDAYEAMLDS